ncbi:MAG: helix-turn-helix domain-containing protein [Chloroflexi bacterium]|nr:helix-turn-helix domain-containing protein [Chloroflexota bacterium]
MGRACTVCIHPERDEIDKALAAGDSLSEVERRFGVSPSAASRHARNHLNPALAKMRAEVKMPAKASLLERVENLIGRAETLFAAASEEGKGAQALNVLKELRALLELLGKASGELDTRPVTVVNLQASPEWLELRAAMFAALQPYPDARAAVSSRLLELEAGQ